MQVIQRRAAIAAVMVALILGAWLGAASGALAGPEFPVNTTTAGTHGRPATVTLAGGKFLVLWEGNTSVGVCNIYAQFFTGNGAKHGPEFIVNAVTTEFQDNPAAAVLDDGTIIVA